MLHDMEGGIRKRNSSLFDGQEWVGHSFANEAYFLLFIYGAVRTVYVCIGYIGRYPKNCCILGIQTAEVTYKGRKLTPNTMELSEKQETLTLTLSQTLEAGHQASVLYTFTGVLNDNLTGFYRSQYTINGESRFHYQQSKTTLNTFSWSHI